MPSLRYSASSVDEMITEKKASQPRNSFEPVDDASGPQDWWRW